MKRKSTFLFFGLLISTLNFVGAQTETLKRFSVTVAPTHFFVGNVKLEAEYRLGKKAGHSLALAPQYYYYNFNDALSSENTLPSSRFYGYGLEVQHKVILTKSDSLSLFEWKPYLSYGVGYSYLLNQYHADVWYPYQDGGLTYIAYGDQLIKDEISRMRYLLCVGVQKRTRSFLFEAFSGLSLQSTTLTEDFEGVTNYDSVFWKYGYQGLAPRAGFKIGLFLF